VTPAQLRSANISIHAICTGAGAGLQRQLWSEPGASAWLSGASFPYSEQETVDVLGFKPERFCSEETAIDLASAAYMKAYVFGGKAPVGIGLTASVATAEAHRGDHRCHVCVVTDTDVIVGSETLRKSTGKSARESDDARCSRLAMDVLERAVLDHVHDSWPVAKATARFLGRPYFDPFGHRCAGVPFERFALMPGAFNPPHEGHAEMAAEVEREHKLPVVFHVSASAPNKPALSVQELLKRAKLLRGHPVLFTRGEALYIEKARRFEGTPIVMGVDALERMLDHRWGPEVKPMLCEFAQLGTGFYVAPRVIGSKRVDLQEVLDRCGVEPELKALFTELGACSDKSSTEIRRRLPMAS
jgi:nicotinamide mononucleotide (NMN) deamidase PncC